jgi:ferritin-like metal-binding protein YciE
MLKRIKFTFPTQKEIEPMDIKTIYSLLLQEMKTLYDVEHQLNKVLPQMAQAAGSTALNNTFEKYLAKTKGHAIRLEIAFEMLGLNPSRRTCKAMTDLVLQSTEVVGKYRDDNLKDAALISVAQQIEHYKITGYRTAYTFATILSNRDMADLFQYMLNEEKQIHKDLIEIAQKIDSQTPV